MSTPALKVSDLSVWIQSGADQRLAVDKVSFSIDAGQATGLVGESGCGKTMVALALLGLLPAGARADCTAIEIDGRDVSGLSANRRRAILGRDIAMVFQQPGTALDPVFTVGQQISAVYRRHISGDKNQATEAVLDSLQSVGFSQPDTVAAAYPHQLSGGMQQLAMIAMATICKPSVIIADEPTTALDSSTMALILQQFKRLRQTSNTAVLFISHDLAVVRQSCSRAMVMYCGRLLEKNDCQALFANPRHPYSAGLLSCIPRVTASRPPAIKPIPGQVPAAADLPGGCHFAPRCTRAEPGCRQSVPAFDADHENGVACFRPL